MRQKLYGRRTPIVNNYPGLPAQLKLNILLTFVYSQSHSFGYTQPFMKRFLFAIILAAAFTACKKEEKGLISPVTNFHFSRSNADEIRIGTTDTAGLISLATNASSISWDLGDGRTLAEPKPVISYTKPGTYTIILTAKASNGAVSTATKKIIVLDRVLKNIVINNVFWNNTDARFAEAGWPLTDAADIYVKIQRLDANQFPSGIFSPNAPVVYQSSALTNIYKVTNTSLSINVTGKIVLDHVPLLDRRYIINLMAKNTAGEYVLVNNWFSGSYQSITVDDITKNTFVVNVGLLSAMALNFDFE